MDWPTVSLIVVIIGIAYLYFTQYVRTLSATAAAEKANKLTIEAQAAQSAALFAKETADTAAKNARNASNAVDAENKRLIAVTARAESDRLDAVALEATCRGQLASLEATKTQLKTDADDCAKNAISLKSKLDELTSTNTTNIAKINELEEDLKSYSPSASFQNLVGIWYPIRGPKAPNFYWIFEWDAGKPRLILIRYCGSPQHKINIADIIEDKDGYIIVTDQKKQMPITKLGINTIEADRIVLKRVNWVDSIQMNYLNTSEMPIATE